MDFHKRYAKLNPAQKQAVDQIDGPLMVVAGPGTGKTELLSMRAANILQKTDTLPQDILCLTFTESGASAMRERLRDIIGADAYKIAVHTFHSFGSEVINQNGQFFYGGAQFHAADELSTYEIIRAIFDELDYDNPLASKLDGEYAYLRDSLKVIGELKKSGLTSDELLGVLDAGDLVIAAATPVLADVFATTVTKSTIEKAAACLDKLPAEDGTILPGISSLAPLIRDSLARAVETSQNDNSTKPLTAWRNAWMQKDENGAFILKAQARAAKLRALSYIYYQYLNRMQETKLYDFDDMILRVVHALEVFDELRFNLQEKYHTGT